jgi:hypothetical protein
VREQLEARLSELQKDFDVGEKRLRDLESEATHLRETLLRISGAIQVVKELLIDPAPAANGAIAPQQSSSGVAG